MLDLLIKNATVLDGTGADAFTADVAVANGKILRVARDITEAAATTIDASGLTLTPGFIDSHSHSDRNALSHPDQSEKIEQGITFSITGQCGGSAAPAVTEEGLMTVSAYMEKAKALPQGSGSGMLIGHGSLRRAVMGTENRPATERELAQMKALLREGMAAGALGLSFGLIYVPGCYADTAECVALARVVGECNGILAAHIRNEGDALLEAVEEFLTIIKASGCRAVFSHHKSAKQQNWGKVKKSLAMIDAANAAGADIYVDVYPYIASHTTLHASFIPKRFHPAGTTSVVALLDDPTVRATVKAWLLETRNNDFGNVLVTKCPGKEEYGGLTINEIADLRGQQDDRTEAVFDIIRLSDGKASGCFFTMCEEDVEYVLKHPRAMICTDSGVSTSDNPYHPRLRGTFPRVLGRYVRERGVTTLPEMIRKMTSLPAAVYGLTSKGRIAEGLDADLCLFDADTIIDRATFTNCRLKNEGLRHVIVDGRIVVTDGVYNGTRAARVI